MRYVKQLQFIKLVDAWKLQTLDHIIWYLKFDKINKFWEAIDARKVYLIEWQI